MRKWYPAVLVIISVVASAIVYPRLPDHIPTHWSVQGQATGSGPRWLVVGLFPALLVAMWGILRFLPAIDPRRENYVKFQGTYDLLVNAALTVALLVHGVAIAIALGAPFSLVRLMPIVAGAMFVVLGNALPRARPNWWFGVRTPWTLSNDRVWERTNRVGGCGLVVFGLVIAFGALLPEDIAFKAMVVLGAILALSIVVYSYIVWRQETSR